jgi:hypothetical protein
MRRLGLPGIKPVSPFVGLFASRTKHLHKKQQRPFKDFGIPKRAKKALLSDYTNFAFGVLFKTVSKAPSLDIFRSGS